MALYATFGDMLTDLRAEAGLSTSPAVGVNANARYKAVINRVYESLYRQHEWPHLKYVAPRFPLAAGQRYYDTPAGLSFERLVNVTAWSGPSRYPLTPGIGAAEYEQFASVDDERYDPPMRYDLRSTSAGSTQVEIWPVPATDDFEIEMSGVRRHYKLVNSSDICLLDGTIVVLFAAADVLAQVNKDLAEIKLAAARALLPSVKGNLVLPNDSAVANTRVGLGGVSVGLQNGRAIVRVR